MAEAVFFYLFTGVMLAAAWSVVFNRQPIYSVLSLLVVMFCLAALFVMLQAYFIAALQVLLYAGAVLVLFLFVIMLLNLAPEALARLRIFTWRTAGTLVALWLAFTLARIFAGSAEKEETALAAFPAPASSVEAIGQLLFDKYLIPFELTSFIILAAIIGAVTLGKRELAGKK